MNDINVPNNDNVSHLSGSMGITEKIKRAMYDAAKEFVYIGFLLYEVKRYRYYEEGGYEDVYDYAAQELGFKKSSTKNFIAISEKFGIRYENNGIYNIGTRTMSLQQEYEKFNYSQLCEMLSMSEKQIQQAAPDMTVKQLREIKKGERPEEASSGQTSGQTEVVNAKGQKGLLGYEANIKGHEIPPGIMIDLCKRAKISYDPNKRYRIFIQEC